MNQKINIVPVSMFGITVYSVIISSFAGSFGQGVSFNVSLRDGQDNEAMQRTIGFTKDEYDAWTSDTVAEDVVLTKLNLTRAA